MNPALSSERNRAIAALLAAALVGLILDQLAWTLALAALALGFRAYWNSARLLEWIVTGRAPPAAESGIWAESFSQLQRQKRKYVARRTKLMEVLRWYSSSADALPEAALILDERNVIIAGNRAVKHTLGIDRKSDRGQRVDNLLRDPMLQSLLNNELPDNVVEIPSPINHNTTLRLRLTAYGQSSKLLLARDISEQIHNHQMRQAFVANVSHELHTPLTVINGHLELLLDDPALASAQREQLQHVSGQAQRMQDIVQDLLVLARLESAPSLAEGQRIEIAPLIVLEADALRNSGKFPEHQLHTDLDDQLALLGRRSEVESVCRNLMFNALKHTPPGTRVEVQWSLQADGRPALKVSDNGPGIAAGHLPRLTERFYRADPSRSSENGGTGLGLAIVKHALQRHGGELRISSELGRGSEFLAVFGAERASQSRP